MDYRPISGDPDRMRGKCHENVDSSLGEFPGAVAVRGWLYDPDADGNGVARFYAHSLIERERGGALIEITYSDTNFVFIRHVDNFDDFWEVARAKPPWICHVYDDAKLDVFNEALKQSLSGGASLQNDDLGDD